MAFLASARAWLSAGLLPPAGLVPVAGVVAVDAVGLDAVGLAEALGAAEAPGEAAGCLLVLLAAPLSPFTICSPVLAPESPPNT